ncbi:type VI secretion system baseplate subunit TssG [Arenibaculum pallidiluteum]|uniref:type VI secretion system baseplate subunit TssG n=1 Tax=Arenibaculum pallidiluteum TaxID=2812559 RepID=UPI001A9682E2|nr:type VI secretion system baseplate subunit TssG [Arenibaculum pallidiluteum]
MVAHRRVPARPLIEELLASPWGFELVQAIAILERSAPEGAPLGEGIDPELEGFRIEQDPTLAFPASDVSSVKPGGDGRPVLRTPAIGLSGISGPMPYAYTEGMLERLSRRDRAMAAFLDIFNHRLTSILYRVRRSTLPLLDAHPERSVAATALRAFVGLGSPGLSNRLPDVPDRMLLGFAGIFADRRRSASALRTVLAGAFGTPVRIRSFEGRWLALEEGSLGILGRNAPEEPRRLGGGAVLGSRVWDQHAAYVVEFRFNDVARFVEFLPTGRHHKAVASYCRFHGGDTCDPVLELVLDAPAVPGLKLSAKDGARLGWTSWVLGTGGAKREGRVRLTAKGGHA